MSEDGRSMKGAICVKKLSTGEIFRGSRADVRKRFKKEGLVPANREEWKAQGRKMLPPLAPGEK